MTAEVVSSYVAHNSVPRAELPALIAAVRTALEGLAAPVPPKADRPEPAVAIRKSVTPDYLVSLEDGKPYKSLKRHLTRLGLSPDQYRAKWGLPAHYPMVAETYAKRRSELAKGHGLGTLRTKSKPATTPVDAARATAGDKPKKRAPAKRKAAE